MSNVKFSLLLLAPPTESLGYTTLMDAPPEGEPMLICSTFRITGLLFTYRYPTLSGASVCYVYLQRNKITLHLWVSYFKCSPFLYAVATEFQRYTTLMGVQP